MPPLPKECYDANPDSSSLYQGDVLRGIPLVFMPPAGKSWILLRPSPGTTLLEALEGRTPKVFAPRSEGALSDAWAHGREFVLAMAEKRTVMIVTQTCDIDNRNFIQVSPVYHADGLTPEKLASLEGDDVKYMFYLPTDSNRIKEKSYADLSQSSPVHKSYLKTDQLVVRHLPARTAKLQARLAELQGRQFGFNPSDSVPQTSDYVCANCFFTSASTQRLKMTQGVLFPPCPLCGEAVLWVKLPS
ncbi:MAG: hypothetical protein ABSH01_02225 [Terriglobia bacterium]